MVQCMLTALRDNRHPDIIRPARTQRHAHVPRGCPTQRSEADVCKYGLVLDRVPFSRLTKDTTFIQGRAAVASRGLDKASADRSA